MNISTTSMSAMAAANTPEEAAKIFIEEASKGLAIIMANAVDKAVSNASPHTAKGSIAGWEKLIGGIAADLQWQSPSLKTGLSNMTCFAPYPNNFGSIHTLGGSVSIGVSVGCTF